MPELYDYEKKMFDHFPKKISKEIATYATDVAFKHSRYIFTRRVKGIQFGYCTHCKKEYTTEGLKHNNEAICIKCKSKCVVKGSGMGRKYMVDDVYFVYYQKSAINPEALVATGIYAVRDYRFDYKNINTMFKTRTMYLFEPGNSSMLQRYMYYSTYTAEGMGHVGYWGKSSTVHSMNFSSNASIRVFCSRDSIKEAIKDTPFQYSTWEKYLDGDMVKFFDLYSKYPCIEYLTKMGFRNIVEAKLHGSGTYSCVNWNGKTINKVLRLNKADINEIRGASISIGPLVLRLYQISKKDKSNLSFKEIYEIVQSYGTYLKDLQKILKQTTLRRAHAFINKQFEKMIKGKKHFYNKHEVLHTWRDYLADCQQLDMDITSENVLFPANIYTAHQNTIKQVKVKEDIALRVQIAKRVRSLQKFSFESQGLLIRPAEDSLELIEEGKQLRHCVGTYAPKYAKGEIDLFVLRIVAEPDKPFFTMEIRKGEITQCRGLKNCAPSKEVEAFIEAFKQEKLTKKTKRRNSKTKIAQPA